MSTTTDIRRPSVRDGAAAPKLVDAETARVLSTEDVRSRAGGADRWVAAQFLLKRIVDVLVALLLLVLLSPFIALLAAAVWMSSPGPVIYRSARIGLGGRRFGCLKFRTMREDADQLQQQLEQLNEADGALFKIDRDPRVTTVGRWLRSSGLDEMPQLVNVVRGSMSLVGPRPLPLRDCALLDQVEWRRHSVLPGISGPWQLDPNRHADEALLAQLDLAYVDRWSIWADVRVMAGTLWFALRRVFSTDSELAAGE